MIKNENTPAVSRRCIDAWNKLPVDSNENSFIDGVRLESQMAFDVYHDRGHSATHQLYRPDREHLPYWKVPLTLFNPFFRKLTQIVCCAKLIILQTVRFTEVNPSCLEGRGLIDLSISG